MLARCLFLAGNTQYQRLLSIYSQRLPLFRKNVCRCHPAARLLSSYYTNYRMRSPVMTTSNPRRSTARFTMPDLPRQQWCDIRLTYIERNLTLSELADLYKCDSRTIKACLIRNKSSKSIGKKSTPTRIDLCRSELKELLSLHLQELPEDIHSVYALSSHLYPLLKEKGYTGSERTLRNYLHNDPAIKSVFEHRSIHQLEKEDNRRPKKGTTHHDQDPKH